MQIQDLLTARTGLPPLLADRQTVADAAALIASSPAGAVIVTSGGRPTGIFTRGDVARAVAEGRGRPLAEIPLAEVTAGRLITAAPGDPVGEALDLMLRAQIARLPIREGDRILAVLTLRELAEAHIGALRAELDELNDYILRLHDSRQD